MPSLSRSFFLVVALTSLVMAAASAGAAAANPASDSGVTVVRVFTGWKEGASFKRISEYFTGKENTGGSVVLRTRAEQRSGFYFFVRLNNPGPATPVKINVEVVTPTDKQTKDFSFSSELKSGANVFDLGLTGEDWLDAKANPVAWKVDFVASDGRVLASEKSYLWEKPGNK